MLLWGIIFSCVSVILFMVILLGSRHPSQPKWADKFMIQYVWVVVILGFAVSGLMIFIFALSADSPPVTTIEILSGLAIAVGTAILLKLIGVKKRLIAYAVGRQAA